MARKKEPFCAAQAEPTWRYLLQTEAKLRRSLRLSRILQPVGFVLFSVLLLLASANFFRFLGGELFEPYFEKLPLLSALTSGFPHGSLFGVIVFTIFFTYGISLAVCGAIVGVSYLRERKKPVSPMPALHGTPAEQAKALAYKAEAVYELRCDIRSRTILPEAGVLTAVTALPIILTLLDYAESSTPSVLPITLACCALLVCLFALYWIYAGLVECFALLLPLLYLCPGKWKLYALYRELDVYWESMDPVEFGRRERLAEAERAGKHRKKAKPADQTA